MTPRLAAARALAAVLQGRASLAGSLPQVLDAVAQRDRALVQELALGSARWYPRLEILAASFMSKPLRKADMDIQALLIIGIYQLLCTRIPAHAAISETVDCAVALKKNWARGMLNAVLRRVQQEAAELLPQLEKDPVVLTAHPRWLQKALKAYWPEHWLDICAANNGHPPMTLRVNTQRISRAEYLQKLERAGIQAQPTRYSTVGIQLERPCDVSQLPGFVDGLCSVQDEAAQLAAGLLELRAGQRVLDACCAPGGKTCHILESGPELAQLLAVDLEPARLRRVEENLQRLNLKAELKAADIRQLDAWWDGQPLDRILLDAPCSATGVIRRNPDIKLTRQADDIAALAQLQGELLDMLWPTLAPGGVLLYATCSSLPQENTQVIEQFLARTADAREWPPDLECGLPQPCGRQLLVQQNGHDGFYYARLRKQHYSALP